MNENELMELLKSLLPGAEVNGVRGDFFWFAASDEKKMLPFLTLVTGNDHDTASNLARPGVYRLNIPLSAAGFLERFGLPPSPRADWGVIATGHDYAALDQLMPHPVYAPLNWACVLNPSLESFEQLRPLLLEAYARAQRKTPKL